MNQCYQIFMPILTKFSWIYKKDIKNWLDFGTFDLIFKVTAVEKLKGFQSKKKWSVFGPKKFGVPLSLRNASLPTPIKCGSNWPTIRNAQEKAKEKGGTERERREKNMWNQIANNNNNNNNKNTMRIHFPTVTPSLWPFVSANFLVVFDCEKQHIYFRFQVICVWSAAYVGFQR